MVFVRYGWCWVCYKTLLYAEGELLTMPEGSDTCEMCCIPCAERIKRERETA